MRENALEGKHEAKGQAGTLGAGRYSKINKEGMIIPDDPKLYEKFQNLKAIPVDNPVMSPKDAKNYYKQHIKEATNNYDGRTAQFVNSTAGKIAGHKENKLISQLLPDLENLFENALPIYSEQEREKASNTNMKQFHNYVTKAKISGEDFYIRYTTQELVPRRDRKKQHDQFHSVFVSDVQIIKVGEVQGPSRITLPGDSSALTNPDNKLLE